MAPDTAVDEILAKLAEKELTPEVIEEALAKESESLPKLSKENLETLLSEAAEKALGTIIDKRYELLIRNEAKRIIYLGLAISNHGMTVKAAFGPK
ncbi:MAG: hypothetical protein LBJ61_05930 [Deltaproteobacteria bacterium]|nr:hypothetical protein [Deltaproteobacteria bacterium]